MLSKLEANTLVGAVNLCISPKSDATDSYNHTSHTLASCSAKTWCGYSVLVPNMHTYLEMESIIITRLKQHNNRQEKSLRIVEPGQIGVT